MTTVLVTLIQNAALLLAMMVVFDLVTVRKPVHGQWQRQALAGVILGGLCIGLMMASFRLETGIIFDTRSVLLSLSGLFLGPIPTVFAMAMAAAYRLWHGGAGVWTGIAVILATGGVGILWRHYRPGRLADISIRELYGFGVSVHLVMLALMLTLPWEAAQRVLGGIGLPVLLVYPIATIALGWLLANRLQRESATDALAASETRYRSLFEAANVGKSVTLPTGEMEVNRAFCDMLGYDAAELRDKTWQEITPPEEIGPINELLAPLLRRESGGIRFEKRYIHKNGSYVWADVSATMQRGRDGKPLHFVVTAVDITERKQAEETLREQYDFSEGLIENAGAIILVLDTQGRIVRFNSYMEDLVGYDLDEVKGMDWFETFTKTEDEDTVKSVFQKTVDDIRTSGTVNPITTRDGRTILVEWNNKTLKDKDGRTVGVLAIGHDITARKAAEAEQRRLLEQVERDRRALVRTLEHQRRTEESLRESEARFRLAVTGAPVPVMIHAEDGQVITVNTPWTRLTGYEHSDIPTIADWNRKAYGTQMDPVRADIDSLYALDGPKADGEYSITTSSGETRIWDFSSAPIGKMPDGRRLVISMAMDVTERKQLETERQKFFLLAESSREFIGMCDLDMNPLYVNPAGRRMVGFPDMAAACRVKVQDYYFPEDQQFIAEQFFPRVLREGHADMEIRLRHFQTGEPIWILLCLFTIHDDSGTPVGWATVSRDITERRQAEEFSRESAERAEGQRNLIAQLTFDDSIINSSIDDALRSVTSRLAATLKVDRCSVWLLSEDETELRRLALYDAGTGIHSQTEVLNTPDIPSYFEALRKDSQVDADDVQNDPRTKELTSNYFVPLQISALLDSAIQQDGRLIGVLSAEHRGSVREWHADERSFLSAITNLVAHLFANAERRQAEDALRESEATVRAKLRSIIEPEGDISTLELSDIIDIEIMQSMMEEFYRATGMLGAVLDLSGKVLVAVGWQNICVKFHRCHPDTLKNCIESDTVLTQGVPPGTFRAYKCKNNMWDMVTPLMVGDRHVGNVFLGQFFHEDETPDVELFRAQARQHGFDETEYLAALARVPRFSRDAVDAGMTFYARLAKIVTTLSYHAIKQARMLAERDRLRKELITLNTELELKVEQRTAALDASNKELEAFSYSVSHDLRAPLRHISGYVDLLNKRYREALPEKAIHYLSEVTDSAKQMGILIDDLLQLSRVGRQQLRRAELDMGALVREVMEKLKAGTQERSISWAVADLPRVVGDPGLLKQVWINLLDNAVKYTRNKAEAEIEVGCTRETGHWVFFVRDNGAGFDMRYAHKLFGVFQRLHSQAEFEGTGIGLANVQRIVHKHGGHVWAEGRLKESAAFYFTMPYNKPGEGGKS